MFGGGLWPVVQRELRESARRPINSWLRLAGAGAGVVFFCCTSTNMPDSIVGGYLFSCLHLLLLCLICALVPALAADCIARERREGTLGLLFMTPLTASGIVLGKILAQTLRAVTFWLAVLPVLTIPFLYGGITWADVAGFLIIEVCAGMICLAAGVLASSLTDHRAIAFILAFLFMGAFVEESRQFQEWTMSRHGARIKRTMVIRTPPGSPYLWNSTRFSPAVAGMLQARGPGFRTYTLAGPGGIFLGNPPAAVLAEDGFIAVMILLVAFRFAGWRVERSWQDKIPSVRQEGLVRRYCTPLFVRWFARRMRRTLERNPIAWLQQYSWKARVSKWGLCLLFVLLECVVIDANSPYALRGLVQALLLVLAAAYTFAGVNGFLQEKKSGALELILVSPLSVNQIIFGRVWGLWKQFLPVVILLAASNTAIEVMIPQDGFFNFNGYYGGSDVGWLWIENIELVAIYLTLPVVATCFALSARNLFVASALTASLVFGPAAILFFRDNLEALHVSHPQNWLALDIQAFLQIAPLPPLPFWILAAHACAAFFAYKYLRRSLARRSYAF
jgi:ABC-type Na+ efflux pump permease subunit